MGASRQRHVFGIDRTAVQVEKRVAFGARGSVKRIWRAESRSGPRPIRANLRDPLLVSTYYIGNAIRHVTAQLIPTSEQT